MKRIILFALLMIAQDCLAQDKSFVQEMRKTIAMQESAATLFSVLKTAQSFERLAIVYEQEWTASYWAAFLYSQAGLFAGDERLKPYIELAQFYFDRASKLKTSRSALEESDFQILQSLLYAFRARAHKEDKAVAGEFNDLSNEFYHKAEASYPGNPRVWTRKGMVLVREEATRKEGIDVLQEAVKKYQQFPSPNVH